MQWSKLRKKVESFLAGSVKGRVGFHFTQYRRVWYGDGRGWITIDKKQVTSMACLTACPTGALQLVTVGDHLRLDEQLVQDES